MLYMTGETILVIEDCVLNLKLTRLILMHEGYEVLAASSAMQGLDLLGSHRPDLILVDLQMPGMDGLTLTAQIKQDEATRDIPVIALTALAMKEDRQKALDAGCDGYLTKPIEIELVRAEIRRFLDRRAGSTHKPATAAAFDKRNLARQSGQCSRPDLQKSTQCREADQGLHPELQAPREPWHVPAFQAPRPQSLPGRL
jgi:CheY-like chemotaxis protein